MKIEAAVLKNGTRVISKRTAVTKKATPEMKLAMG
jgi:hypothetical protein